MPTPSVESRLISRLQDVVETLEAGGPIEERFALRRIRLNLKPKPYDKVSVKQVRGLLGVSQVVFALYLGVSPKTVQSWEQGVNSPTGIACNFMELIRRDPETHRRRLKDAAAVEAE